MYSSIPVSTISPASILVDVIPIENILCLGDGGAVRGIDPETGWYFDDTKRYIDNCVALSDADRQSIFEGNARRVFSRMRL